MKLLNTLGSPNNTVEDILIDESLTPGGSDDRLYICGAFTQIGATANSFLRIAKYTFSNVPDLSDSAINLAGTWSPLGQGPPSAAGGFPDTFPLRMLRYVSGVTRFIYITGNFSTTTPITSPLSKRVTRYNPDSGTYGIFNALGTTITFDTLGTGNDLLIKQIGGVDWLFVCGNLSTGITGVANTAHIARFNIATSTWYSVTGTSPLSGITAMLDYSPTQILVAGISLDTWNPAPDNIMAGVAMIDVSGSSTTVNCTRLPFAGITVSSASNAIQRLFKASYDGSIYIMGGLTRVGRNINFSPAIPGDNQVYEAHYLARLDTSVSPPIWKPITNTSPVVGTTFISCMIDWFDNKLLVSSTNPYLWNGQGQGTQSLAVLDPTKIIYINGTFYWNGKTYTQLELSQLDASVSLISTATPAPGWIVEATSGLSNTASSVGFGGINIM